MPSRYGEPATEQAVSRTVRQSWPILTASINYTAIARWDVEGLIRSFDWGQWIQFLGHTIPSLERQVNRAIRLERADIVGELRKAADDSFSHIDPVAVHFAAQQGSKLIANLMDSQKAAIRAIIAKALNGQYTVDQAARAIRDCIGLHPKWASAVDKRWWQTYYVALAEGRSGAVAADRADRISSIYHDRLVRSRAEAIARTEIQTAANAGRYATWDQMAMQNVIGGGSLKEWAPGPGACPICQNLAGEQVPWDQPFSNGSMMPPAHTNCRCSAVMLPAPSRNPLLAVQHLDWTSPTLTPEALLFPERPDL